MSDLSERALSIDDSSGSPLDVSELIVGGLGDLGKLAHAKMDLTGAMHERPKGKHSGFATPASFTLTVEKTDPTYLAFYKAATTSNPRTVTLTRRTTGDDQTFAIEANIIDTFCPTEPGENGLDTIVFTMEPTGSETIA